MNPIASVISRIETIESRLSQALEQSQSHVTDTARTGRTVGQVAAQTIAGTVPSSDAPTTFADALATIERSVSEAVDRHQNAPATRPVSMPTTRHDCEPETVPAANVDTTPRTAPARPIATAPIAPASATTAAAPATPAGNVDAVPQIASTSTTPAPSVASEAAVPATWTAASVPTTAAMPSRPVDGLPGDAAGTVGEVPFAGDFEAAGARHGVPPRLLSAMAFVESRYLPDVVADRGAVGMMQLMPDTAAELGVDPRNPAASVDGAARLIGSLYDQFGSWDHALAAYHTGAEALTANGNEPTTSGAAYTGRVMDRLSTMTT